jgi:hypothetical protein
MLRSRPIGLMTLALSVPLLALGAACGGGSSRASVAPASKTKPADGAATTTTAPGAGANGSSASGAGGHTTTTARGGAAQQAGPGSASGAGSAGSPGAGQSPPSGQLTIQVSLASPCVKPGTPQTITITTKPNTGVAYNAIYADGNNARDNRTDFYGGNKGDRTNAQGTWADTWTVSPKAAAGPVHVDVVGMTFQGESGYTTAGFAVARPDGSCA